MDYKKILEFLDSNMKNQKMISSIQRHFKKKHLQLLNYLMLIVTNKVLKMSDELQIYVVILRLCKILQRQNYVRQCIDAHHFS